MLLFYSYYYNPSAVVLLLLLSYLYYSLLSTTTLFSLLLLLSTTLFSLLSQILITAVMPTMKPFMNADWILFAPIAYFFLPMMSTIAYYICWLDYLCTMFSWMSSNREIRPCPMQLLARNGDLMAGLDVSHGSMAFMTLFYVPYAANAMMTWKGNYIWGKTVIWGAFGC